MSFVTVGNLYSKIGSGIYNIIPILFDCDNISFVASLVIYINNSSIPPKLFMSRMYDNQYLLYIVPLLRHTTVI